MTVVVKIGGAAAVDPAGALADVAALREEGRDVAVVHGGSTAMDETLERMDIDPEYVETPDGVVGRFTDEETMDVFKMVLPGLVNTDIVAGLQNEGVDAVGLSGVDGALLTGPRKSAVRVVEDGKKKIKRGDHSGTIEDVNGDLLDLHLEAGYTPVVSVPMLGVEEDGSFTPVNSDADRSAAAVAGELGGERAAGDEEVSLVLLTDVSGIYEDPDDESTRIDRVDAPEAFEHLTEVAQGFMRRKTMAAQEALQQGADRVVVGTANADRPIRNALDGNGTTITAEALGEDA